MALTLTPERFAKQSALGSLTPSQRQVLEIHAQLFAPDDESDEPALQQLGKVISTELLRELATKSVFRVTDTAQPDRIVGMISLDPGSDSTLHIDTLVVDKAHRGKRLGSGTLALLESLARNNGNDAIALNPVSDDAERFYERNGYTFDGEGTMVKDL